MNGLPPRYPPAKRTLRWAFWIIPPLAVLLLFGLALYAVTGFFRLGKDAGCLRDSLAASRTVWRKQFEFNVGTVSFALLRSGLSFAPMKPEVRAVVNSIRAGEVGLYHLQRGAAGPDPAALLAKADEAMSRRGWERMVGVTKEHELVAVYVPKDQRNRLEACVAVLNRHDLVLASGRTKLEPLNGIGPQPP